MEIQCDENDVISHENGEDGRDGGEEYDGHSDTSGGHAANHAHNGRHYGGQHGGHYFGGHSGGHSGGDLSGHSGGHLGGHLDRHSGGLHNGHCGAHQSGHGGPSASNPEVGNGDVHMGEEGTEQPSSSQISNLSLHSAHSLRSTDQSPTSSQGEHHDAIRSPNPRRRQRSVAEIHIPNSLTDSERYPLCLERYFHPDNLLLPKPSDLLSIESQSKTFSMQEADDLHESAGLTWSFVDLCPAGLSDELRQVLYFFDIINGMANHHIWNGFTVPTEPLMCSEHTRLKPKYMPNLKDICGVVLDEFRDSDEGPSESTLLADDSCELVAGTRQSEMPFLRINVGFTAAVYKSTQGETDDKYAIFGVVSVTSLLNVDSLRLILERFLAPPAARSQNFKDNSKMQRQLLELFEHIIIYQAAGVMGDTSTERPKDYFCNPGGRLGIDKVCHPGMEPFKMCKLLSKLCPAVRDVRIIGYPQIDWLRDHNLPGGTKDHWTYVKAARARQMMARDELKTACEQFSAPKKVGKKRGREEEASDEPEQTEWHVTGYYGWPEERTGRWYSKFVSSLCPINMSLRRLKEVDIHESYNSWCLNVGSIPPLALCLLRCCLLFDPQSPESCQLDNILLRELDVPWNLALVRQRFYGLESQTHDHIAMPGCQLGNYKEIMQHIRNSVQIGSLSPDGAVRLLCKVVDYGINVFTGMAEANSFLSERVTQALRIMKRIRHEETKGNANFRRSLRAYQKHLLATEDPKSCDRAIFFNPYDRARRTLLRASVDVNRFEHLNSGNMQLKWELLISMVTYTMGFDNETHQPFGRGVELAPGCGTLSDILSVGNKKVVIRCVACDNSAGKDFSAKKVSNNFSSFCQQFGFDKSLQGLMVLKRFTPVSLENMTTLHFENGEIIAYPDETLNGKFFIITESRGNTEGDQDSLIKYAYGRGDKQDEASLTTCEGEHKIRRLLSKQSMSTLNICTRCSNEPLSSLRAFEQSNTIAAVTMQLEAGSAPYNPGTQEGDFQDVQSNAYDARSVPFEGLTEQHAPNMIAGTHLHCTTYMGLPNILGTYLCEICPPTLATLDWLNFFSEKHLKSLFHSKCRGNNMLRLQRVYEARATGFTAWCKMTQFLTDCEDRDKAIKRAVESFQCDAIALTDCPGMLWSLLRRCLHWGPILYSCCFMKETAMPIVPTHILVELLKTPARPRNDSPARVWYDRVCAWLQVCVEQHRFCPVEGAYNEFTEYISSSGSEDGTVSSNGVLRVSLGYNAWKDRNSPRAAQTHLAEAVYRLYGAELMQACSMNQTAVSCAVDDMLSGFSVDIQKLLGVNMFDMDRHLQFFGLRDKLNFKCQPRIGDHPYMIRSVWQKETKEVLSLGGGVHFVQILVLGSLIGCFAVEKLHPKIINDLTLGLIKQILRYAPAGIVPGNTVEIRGFDCISGQLESITLEDGHTTIQHFIRPNDVFFAESGELSRCRNFDNLAAEDLLHLGPLCEVARRIGCKVTEVPASAEVTYYIRPKKTYCVHNPLSGCTGTLYYDGIRNVTLEYQTSPDDEMLSGKQLSLFKWQDELRNLGFTILPMIWRSGACVAWNGKVGCIVPPRAGCSGGDDMSDDDQGMQDVGNGNFCTRDRSYVVNLGRGEYVRLTALKALEMLFPIGQRLYLKMESQSAAPMVRRVERAIQANRLASHALQVHLDSPNTTAPVEGKIYVVCLVRNMSYNEQMTGSCCEVLVVDPWELLIQSEGRRVFDHVLE